MHIAALVISLFAGIFSFFQGGLLTIVGGLGGGLGEYGGDTAFAEEAYMAGGAGMIVVFAAITGIVAGILAGMKKRYAWKVLVAASIMCILAGFGVFSDAFIYAILYGIAAFCSYKSINPEFLKGKNLKDVQEGMSTLCSKAQQIPDVLNKRRTTPPSVPSAASSNPNTITQGTHIQPKFCPQCGTKLQSGFAFCPNCGQKLEISSNLVPVEKNEESTQKSEESAEIPEIPEGLPKKERECTEISEKVPKKDAQSIQSPQSLVQNVKVSEELLNTKSFFSTNHRKIYMIVGVFISILLFFLIFNNVDSGYESSYSGDCVSYTDAENCTLRTMHSLSGKQLLLLGKGEPVEVLESWKNNSSSMRLAYSVNFHVEQGEVFCEKGRLVKIIEPVPGRSFKIAFSSNGNDYSAVVDMNFLDYCWFKVKTQNGQVGWLHSSLLRDEEYDS